MATNGDINCGLCPLGDEPLRVRINIPQCPDPEMNECVIEWVCECIQLLRGAVLLATFEAVDKWSDDKSFEVNMLVHVLGN